MTQEEKLYICKIIRREAGCGLYEAQKGIEKLIYAFKHRPPVIADNPHKLIIDWEKTCN